MTRWIPIPWIVLALAACNQATLNRIDPPASISGGDGGWTPVDTDSENIPNCGMLGCSEAKWKDGGRE